MDLSSRADDGLAWRKWQAHILGGRRTTSAAVAGFDLACTGTAVSVDVVSIVAGEYKALSITANFGTVAANWIEAVLANGAGLVSHATVAERQASFAEIGGRVIETAWVACSLSADAVVEGVSHVGTGEALAGSRAGAGAASGVALYAPQSGLIVATVADAVLAVVEGVGPTLNA